MIHRNFVKDTKINCVIIIYLSNTLNLVFSIKYFSKILVFDLTIHLRDQFYLLWLWF